MRYLIDTNACIYLFRGDIPKLTSRVAQTTRGDIGLSAIVLAELALGTAQGKLPSSNGLEQLIRQMPLVPFDEAAARAYALLPFRRASFDRLLAAQAISLGVTLITSNIGDFSAVPGLSAQDWTA